MYIVCFATTMELFRNNSKLSRKTLNTINLNNSWIRKQSTRKFKNILNWMTGIYNISKYVGCY